MGRPRQGERLCGRARRRLVAGLLCVALAAGLLVAGGWSGQPQPVRQVTAGPTERTAAATEAPAMPVLPVPVPTARAAAGTTSAPGIPPETAPSPSPPVAATRTPSRGGVGAQPAPPVDGVGVWAVVVGINDYPGARTDLRAAVRDASTMSQALQGYGVPASQWIVLTEGRATTPRILGALDWLVTHAGPDATAVFFFAGHVKHLGRDRQAMVAADGGLVGDLQLAARLDHLQAARTWLVFASCYGGGFVEALRPGRILTAAADGQSLAYEDTGLGQSYLVEYMVRQAMVERRAERSVEASFTYAVRAIRRDHPNRVPVQYDRLPGELALGRRSSTTTAPARRSCALQVGALVTCGAKE